MLKRTTIRLLFSAAPVTININTAPAPNNWFWGAISGVKAFADAHPYITYAAIDLTVGVAAYFIGGSLFGRSLEASLADPASAARVIQTNANPRNEMERTCATLAEVRDSLASIKLEVRRVQADAFISLAQQRQATDAVVRESAAMLITINTNLVAVHESVVQVLAVAGH